MTEYEGTSSQDPVESGALEDEDEELQEPQQGKGYGQDEGEYGGSLNGE